MIVDFPMKPTPYTSVLLFFKEGVVNSTSAKNGLTLTTTRDGNPDQVVVEVRRITRQQVNHIRSGIESSSLIKCCSGKTQLVTICNSILTRASSASCSSSSAKG